MREIDRETFVSRLAEAPLVIDVREPEEYVAGHVRGAQPIPMAAILGRPDSLPTDVSVYVICASGNRSLTVPTSSPSTESMLGRSPAAPAPGLRPADRS